MGEPKFKVGDVVRDDQGVVARCPEPTWSNTQRQWARRLWEKLAPLVEQDLRDVLTYTETLWLRRHVGGWDAWLNTSRETPAEAEAARAIVAKLAELGGVEQQKPELTGESLRKRREALGWTPNDAANAIYAAARVDLDTCQIKRIESGEPTTAPYLERYDAALTAEEKRRAGVEAPECGSVSEPDPADGSVTVSVGDVRIASVACSGFIRWTPQGVGHAIGRPFAQSVAVRREREWAAMQAANPKPPLGPVPVEAPEKVATWDAGMQHYHLTPALMDTHTCTPATKHRKHAEAWGYRIVGGPEQAAQPETWHERLVRLAREAEERRIAYETAAKAEEDAAQFATDAHKAMREAERAFAEASEASAILAAGGGK